MSTSSKTVLVLAAPDHEDLELHYPAIRMKEAGCTVIVAGLGEDSYRGKKGHPVEVDRDVSDVNPDEVDALVIPGGHGPDVLRTDEHVLDLVRSLDGAKKPIAAICHAPWVLISAGVVAGRTVTSYPSIRDDLRNAGAEVADRPVVVDGHLITSRVPADLPDFCRALIAAL